jgi:tetratricopeptide (TPR) repeat protein
VYLEIARIQKSSKQYDAVLNTLDNIIADKNYTTFQISEAIYQKARLLRDKMNKLDEAIECLEKSPLRSAQNEVTQWKNQSEIK